MKRNLFSTAHLAPLLALALVACGQPAPQGKPKLVLGDQVGLTRAKIDAAGALKGAPFDYEWAIFPGAAPLFEALVAGAVDTALGGDTPVIAAAAANAPMRIVAAMRSSGKGIAILVPGDSPIRKVADLRGKQVIVSSARGSISQYLLLGALREAGVDPKDVKIGFMLPGDASAAFASGRIDAWATFGTYQIAAEQRGARVLRDGVGINSGLSFITVAASTLDDPAKRPAVVEYIRRQRAANEWSRAHHDEYVDVFESVTHVSPTVAKATVDRENPELLPLTPAIVAELQHVADRFYEEGVLPKKVDIAPLIDTSVFRDVEAQPPFKP